MDNSSTGEDVEKLGPSHTAGRNVNGTSGTTLKKSLAVLKQLNTELPYNPAILLDMYPRELKIDFYTNILTLVDSSITHDSQKVETTQMFNW